MGPKLIQASRAACGLPCTVSHSVGQFKRYSLGHRIYPPYAIYYIPDDRSSMPRCQHSVHGMGPCFSDGVWGARYFFASTGSAGVGPLTVQPAGRRGRAGYHSQTSWRRPWAGWTVSGPTPALPADTTRALLTSAKNRRAPAMRPHAMRPRVDVSRDGVIQSIQQALTDKSTWRVTRAENRRLVLAGGVRLGKAVLHSRADHMQRRARCSSMAR